MSLYILAHNLQSVNMISCIFFLNFLRNYMEKDMTKEVTCGIITVYEKLLCVLIWFSFLWFYLFNLDG